MKLLSASLFAAAVLLSAANAILTSPYPLTAEQLGGGTPASQLGMNVNRYGPHETSMPFANLAKQADPWDTGNLDADGYPQQMANADLIGGEPDYPAGTYELAWTGAECRLEGPAVSNDSGDLGGYRTYTLDGTSQVRLHTEGAISAVSVVRDGQLRAYMADEWVTTLLGIHPSIVRDLDWGAVNGTPAGWVKAGGRRRIAECRWQGRVPYEVRAQAAMNVGAKYLWSSVPIAASQAGTTDDADLEAYVREVTAVVAGELVLGTTWIVDAGSEVWNTTFGPGMWANATRDPMSTTLGAFYGDRIRQVLGWVEDEWVTVQSKPRGKLKLVLLGHQAVGDSFVTQAFLGFDAALGAYSPEASAIDVLAVGFYVRPLAADQVLWSDCLPPTCPGDDTATGGGVTPTPLETIASMQANVSVTLAVEMAYWKQVADAHGVDFMGYEGSESTATSDNDELWTAPAAAATALAETEDLTTDILDTAAAYMDRLCWYNYRQANSTLGGSWGALVLYGTTTPKWQALEGF